MQDSKRAITAYDLVVWHLVGAASAMAFVTLSALGGASLVPLDEHRWSDAYLNAMMTAYYLVLGTPLSLAFLFLWMRAAKRHRVLEQNPKIRIIALCTFCALTTIVILTCLLIVDNAQSLHDNRLSLSQLMLDKEREVAVVVLFYCVWAVAPRIILPSLRKPLFMKGWAKA